MRELHILHGLLADADRMTRKARETTAIGDRKYAFGLRLDVQGMELAHTGVGALLYTADGNVDWGQQHLYVFSIPGNLHGDMMAFRRICEASGHQMFGEKSRTPMRYQAHDGIHVCDTWGQPGLIGSDYYAGLMLPDGSVIQATGLGNPSTFQHALLALHRIPR